MKTIISSMLLIIFICSCAKESFRTDDYAVRVLQDYDQKLCSSHGTIKGGYENIGISIDAYDKETKEKIVTKSEYIFFPQQGGGGGGTHSDMFHCYMTDPSYNMTVSVMTDGYLPIDGMAIHGVKTKKMNKIDVMMEKKPKCYLDTKNMEHYITTIEKEFGMKESEYELKCADAQIARGGYTKAIGVTKDNESFELMYHRGWCSSGGADCGWMKCISIEDDKGLFEKVKEKVCAELSYENYYDGQICTSEAFSRDEEVRKSCMDGAFDYVSENKYTISFIQDMNRCSSSVKKGNASCYSIFR